MIVDVMRKLFPMEGIEGNWPLAKGQRVTDRFGGADLVLTHEGDWVTLAFDDQEAVALSILPDEQAAHFMLFMRDDQIYAVLAPLPLGGVNVRLKLYL